MSLISCNKGDIELYIGKEIFPIKSMSVTREYTENGIGPYQINAILYNDIKINKSYRLPEIKVVINDINEITKSIEPISTYSDIVSMDIENNKIKIDARIREPS